MHFADTAIRESKRQRATICISISAIITDISQIQNPTYIRCKVILKILAHIHHLVHLKSRNYMNIIPHSKCDELLIISTTQSFATSVSMHDLIGAAYFQSCLIGTHTL